MKRLKLKLRQAKALWGFLFTFPFLLGFVLFFLVPLLQSLRFSVSELNVFPTGYQLQYVGLKHYNFLLFVDTGYLRIVVETILKTLRDIPMIIFFSFFVAVILNQKFKGRVLARVIFFLPVILGAGVVLRLEQQDTMTRILKAAELAGTRLGGSMFSAAAVRSFFLQMQIPARALEYLVSAIDNVHLIIRSSGIQILIFLAGLQSVSPTLYEVADVEGATGWERFWLITFPLLTPLLLTNIVYTFVDVFTASDNAVMEQIYNTSFAGEGYSVSSAMAWFYFLLVAFLLALTVKIISKGVFYSE